jgi:hypothetical protein
MSTFGSLGWLTGLALGAIAAGWDRAQGGHEPAKGVKCPPNYETLYDPTSKVLSCRRDIVSWVVTACAERQFATYSVRKGPDACAPTEVPGVGTPPGARGVRKVTCAGPGFELMIDRTGERDRCERVERVFALPQPAG